MALTRATDKIIANANGNLNLSGIVTAATFSGAFSGDGSSLTGVASTDNIKTSTNAVLSGIVTTGALNVSGNATINGNATVTGNLGVGGVVTYEDVTNVDSIGIITARSSINVKSASSGIGITLSSGGINVTGIITANSYRGDGSQLTGIDASALSSGGSVKVQANSHGAVTTGVHTATAFNGIIVPATYPGGRRNMFINGEFSINQRGTRDPHANQNNGANNLGYGGPDHVQVVKNIGSYDAKQANENSSPRTQAGASYSYELDVTATGSTSNTGYCFLNWMWNGHEVNRLLYGTSSARPITVSFWCQSNLTGTFGLNMRNYSTDRMISQALTIDSANTWEYKTVTFVGDTAAQFAVTINAAMAIELWLAAGTDYNSGSPQSTWASRNDTKRSAGTNINIASNTSNYFRISLLQVEMGEFATPFEFRTYGEYLHDCEYYFQKPFSSRGSNQAFAIHIWGHKIADTYALRVQTMMRPTEMRINPTDYFHDNNPSGLTAGRYQTQGSDYEYTYNVGMSIGSNRKEFANGTKYPYGVNGMGSAESGILFAYDFESYAEY